MWDVDRLADEMPARLFEEWREFARLEPFGFEWDWLRTGTVAAAAYNARPFRPDGARWHTAAEFVPDFDRPPPKPLTPAERRARAVALARATAGRVTEVKKGEEP